MSDSFLDLQSGFYNALIQGLGFKIGDLFQVVQPSPPLASGEQADRLLWNYFNNIPPFSLTQNYVASGGNQFFSNYSGLLSALIPATPSRFVEVVGQEVNDKWFAYSNAKLPITFPLNQLPQAFRNWAVRSGHMAVATSGASAMAADFLDPITAAQTTVSTLYMDEKLAFKQPDWNPGYNTLMQMLGTAPSRSFELCSSTMSSDVSKSWTNGSNSGFFGLWSSSSSTSSISQQFSSSGVKVEASFAHVLPFSAVPGQWYSSAAMGLSYSNRTGNPWNSSSSINWQNTFGSSGNLQRFAVQLIVVDTMNIEVTSQANFSTDDQNNISQNSGSGMWPFYASNSGSGSSTSAKFDNNGKMTVHINSSPGVPIVIGINVLPVDIFVGHSISSAQFMYDSCLKRGRE